MRIKHTELSTSGVRKGQRSLKKAAMLATNCKLQTGDWKLDAGDLTRRGYGEFNIFFRF